MSYSDLKGKAYLLTGAASGQGRETALALARQGANVGTKVLLLLIELFSIDLL